MSDIKKFLLRLPVDLYESLELDAIKLNMSMNALAVSRLSDSVGRVPKAAEAIEKTRAMAATLPNTFAGSDIRHAQNCACWTCKPPK